MGEIDPNISRSFSFVTMFPKFLSKILRKYLSIKYIFIQMKWSHEFNLWIFIMNNGSLI